jgi:uncharacterized phage infection (PIP) family protein YhgE
VDEWIKVAKGIIEIGFAAASALTVLGLLIFHQYKLLPIINALVYSSQRLIESADKLASDLSDHHENSIKVTQLANDMYDTCQIHGGQLDRMSSGMNDFRSKLMDRISALEKEVALLKERLS